MADTYVLIDRESLEALTTVAIAALEDLRDGLADGTYEEDSLGGYSSDEVDAALAAAEWVLA